MGEMVIKHEDLIGTFEQKKELVSKFSLFQDIFFSVVMRNIEAAEYVLRVCMGIPDLKIIKSNTQQAFRNLFGKSSTLDFIAQDSEGHIYNIEVQNTDTAEFFGAKRSRYYQSIIDSSLIDKGTPYDEIPEVYIIFLTPFNPLKKYDRHSVIYKKVSYLDGVEWDNGVHEIYINSEEKDDSQLSEMMQYFIKADPEDNRFGALSDAVAKHKTDVEEVTFMCKEVEDYARERENIKAVRMVNKLIAKGESLESALEFVEIDEATFNEYKDKV